MHERPLAIDLFAGAGGMSLGFEQAGFDIVVAVEIDPIHAAIHHFNFPRTAVIAKSGVGLRGDDVRAAAGIGRRSVDVVFGGPPCQGFSLIGQRMLDDSRNHLVKEFVRLVAELKAKTFVFENVKGLTIGNHRRFLDALIGAFDEAGYRVRLPWRVLNAVNYGIPQDRERLFLLGARKGCKLPLYPEPTTTPEIDLFGTNGKGLTPTCAEALSDLSDADIFPELMTSDTVEVTDWTARTEYGLACRSENKDTWHFGYLRTWQPNLLTSSMRTVHTDISRRRFAATRPGEIEPISRFFKLPPDGVCNTLRAGTDSARGAFTSPRPIHYAFPRCITVREMARLHGYPDWFRFHVTKWHGARQVGNSVPPPVARAVAGAIVEALEIVPTRPNRKIALGSPALLSMDMGEAADFWKVPVPIGRRNRKNGLHKRKQSEIEASMGSEARGAW
ncbi:MAG: DNA cytosine methyltransferase [Deltaproteobacteria bacterium]|nr:DNA cytosine methyltransferase [Deltaproteobacteria bacterium]